MHLNHVRRYDKYRSSSQFIFFNEWTLHMCEVHVKKKLCTAFQACMVQRPIRNQIKERQLKLSWPLFQNGQRGTSKHLRPLTNPRLAKILEAQLTMITPTKYQLTKPISQKRLDRYLKWTNIFVEQTWFNPNIILLLISVMEFLRNWFSKFDISLVRYGGKFGESDEDSLK